MTMASYLDDQAPLRKKGTSHCMYHKKKELIFICNDCTELICPTCSLSTHKNHDLSELSLNIEGKKSRLHEFINNTERQTLPKLKQDMQDLGKRQTETSDELKEVVANFKQHGEKCKHAIDVHISEFSSFCDDMDGRNKNLIKTLKTQIQQRYDELDKILKECKQVLQTGTAIQVYDVDLPRNYRDLQIPDLQRVEFCPCKFIPGHIKAALGTVTIKNDPNYHSTPNEHIEQRRPRNQTPSDILLDQPEVLSQFKYDKYVTRLQPTPDNCCWFSYYMSEIIILVDNKGKIKQEIKHHCNVWDISLSPNTGHLWFCCYSDKTINEVLPTLESPVTRFTIEDWPYRLCMTREDNAVVGTFDNRVTVYTPDGKALHTTTKKESGIGSPQDISQCPITGNIAVVSSDKEGQKHHIIVYDNTLNTRYHYRGEGIPGVTPDMFDPTSICYDSRGHLVIADWKRKTIDLISGTGHYTDTLQRSTEEQRCIGIQTNGVVWAEVESDTGHKYIKLLKYYRD